MQDRAASRARQQKQQSLIIEEKVTKFNGEVSIKKYTRRRLLGKGGFARCYELVNHETKKVSAVKIVQKSSLVKSRTKQKLISQIKIHKSLKHPNIVQFQHVFQDSQNVYIVLELCTNYTLNQMLKRRKKLTELELQIIVTQLTNALKYLKLNKIIHRDLKLGNLFIAESMDIKLGDFGLATRLQHDGEKKKTICGTPNYIAPQILQGKGHSYQVDIWSLGVLIFAGLFGKPPFQTPQVKTTYRRIRSCIYSFPEGATVSQPVKSLITKIFQLDPSKRPNIEQIQNCLFMNPGYPIPKTLQKSYLNFVPSRTLTQQFAPRKLNSKPDVDKEKKTFFPEKTPEQPQQPRQSNTVKEKIRDALSKQKDVKDKMFASTNGFFKSASKDFRATQTIKLNNFSSMQTLPPKAQEQMKVAIKPAFSYNQVYVLKWVDYSSKYGLGYLLSDDTVGVHFNDLTKMVLDCKQQYFDYIDSKNQQTTRYTFQSCPKDREMNKKVTLLQHFKAQLQNINAEQRVVPMDRRMVYVKKWISSNHAMIFRLSNKIVQANFQDSTEIILSSQKKNVIYVNKKRQRSEHPLCNALESRNYEMVKRLKYLKQVLMQMLNGEQTRATMASRQSRQSRF